MISKRLLALLLTFQVSEIITSHLSCEDFTSVYRKAKRLIDGRCQFDRRLQSTGRVVMEPHDIGFLNPRESREKYLNCREADVFTETAKLLADKNLTELDSFDDYGYCLGRSLKPEIDHPKYRAIDGFGNNLKNPHWGASKSPFKRFAPKAYDDGVHSIRRSVTGAELPNPRKIVQNVLLKAEKVGKPKNLPNMLISLIVLYLTHDMAHQVPSETFSNGEGIRCCSSRNRDVLSPSLMHSSCLPISIADDDPFYRHGDIGCLNLHRSVLSSPKCCLQFGEIRNKATSFLDHSIVYGTEESAARSIRTLEKGRLRLDKKNVLPVDRRGRYLDSSERLTAVPIGVLWPALFARNHNKLAESLLVINPQWSDETLYQEARRVNIAIFQKSLIQGEVIEKVFKKKINETYNETFDTSTSLEFSTAYRMGHFYAQSNMPLVDGNGTVVDEIPLSDTIGRVDIVGERFDEVLRGALLQPINFEQYTDEVVLKFLPPT